MQSLERYRYQSFALRLAVSCDRCYLVLAEAVLRNRLKATRYKFQNDVELLTSNLRHLGCVGGVQGGFRPSGLSPTFCNERRLMQRPAP